MSLFGMNYETFFSELEMFGIKLGLEQTRELFYRIGSPDEKLRFIHIAGTNGKGSVASMLAAALSTAGFKTGLYTSPHLVSIRERFRINGKAISETDLKRLVSKIRPAISAMIEDEGSPTYFEVTTALAAAYFAENQVDFVLWETGLGGRFDASNIVTPIVSIITGIGLEHTTYLGSSLAEVAFEKAGIIKDTIPVFCGILPDEAVEVIKQKAAETCSELHFIEEIKEKASEAPSTLLMTGGPPIKDYKAQNRGLATEVLKYLAEKFTFPFAQALTGFDQVHWPGRLQIMPDGTIVDGAHNPQAARALMAALSEKFPKQKYSILFASFADKDAGNTLKLLAPIAEEFIFAEVGTTRKTCHPDKLAAMVRDFPEIPITKVDTPTDGLQVPRNVPLLVTGSLYLVGEIIKEFIQESEILDVF